MNETQINRDNGAMQIAAMEAMNNNDYGRVYMLCRVYFDEHPEEHNVCLSVLS